MLPMLILSTLARFAPPLAPTVLSWMLALTPAAPWSGTFEATADAIAEAATAHPLYPGVDGPRRTAALLVSLSSFESAFDPAAVGDRSRSYGLFQVSTAHAPVAELVDPRTASEHAIRLLRASMWICRDRPGADQLAWYAHGGAGCATDERSVRLSRHRVQRASALLR